MASRKKTSVQSVKRVIQKKPVVVSVQKRWALKKSAAITKTPAGQNNTSSTIEESKFYTGPQTAAAVLPPARPQYEVADLPSGYADNHIILLVRDPYWAYTYWEVSPAKKTEVELRYSISLDQARRILRVYDVTHISFNGTNANAYFDIDVDNIANNWYVNLGQPGRSYCVDLGVFTPQGEFVVLARSNVVTTPLDGASSITDEEWMIIDETFNKLYGMAVGLGIGLSSAEIKKRLKQRMQTPVSSGGLSSLGLASPVKKQVERGFWLVANTELIVYGATEPNAGVTVQNQPIKLNKDGTFSLRFALPDGIQVIPVEATSFDGQEKRRITPIVKKNTE